VYSRTLAQATNLPPGRHRRRIISPVSTSAPGAPTRRPRLPRLLGAQPLAVAWFLFVCYHWRVEAALYLLALVPAAAALNVFLVLRARRPLCRPVCP